MFYKITVKFILILFILLPIFSVQAIDINSNNAILYNLNDDSVIYEKNSDDRVSVASLTKIMTAIVAIENIHDIDAKVVMPRDAFYDLDGYVTSGIGYFDTVTYRDLLYGIMLPSAADCANAIAKLVSGSTQDFVVLMNNKALDLGLTDTHFSNPIGKDDDNYSTVHDISVILKYALDNDIFYEIFTTKEYVTSNGVLLKSTLVDKYNKYDLDISNILGSKTGFTDSAGFCLASISSINGVDYLLVTTGADTDRPYQVIDAVDIYNYYSSNYGYKKILGYNQYLTTLSIGGKDYDIYSNNDVFMYLNNDIQDFSYEFISNYSDDVNKDDFVGVVNVIYNNEVLYSYDVYFPVYIYDYSYLFLLLLLIPILFIAKFVIYKFKNI